jgi:hypothetical protein
MSNPQKYREQHGIKMSDSTRHAMAGRVYTNPRTGKQTRFPRDAKRYVAYVGTLRGAKGGDGEAEACENGHYDCAAWVDGPCCNHVMAEFDGDWNDCWKEEQRRQQARTAELNARVRAETGFASFADMFKSLKGGYLPTLRVWPGDSAETVENIRDIRWVCKNNGFKVHPATLEG